MHFLYFATQARQNRHIYLNRLLLKQSGYRGKDSTYSGCNNTKESNNPRKDFFPKNNNKDNSKNGHNQQIL